MASAPESAGDSYNFERCVGAGAHTVFRTCDRHIFLVFQSRLLLEDKEEIYKNKNKILEECKILEQILKKDELNFGLKAAVNIAIGKFLESDFSACKTYLSISSNIQNKLTTDYKNEKIYS